jgi:hypothetical protein
LIFQGGATDRHDSGVVLAWAESQHIRLEETAGTNTPTKNFMTYDYF